MKSRVISLNSSPRVFSSLNFVVVSRLTQLPPVQEAYFFLTIWVELERISLCEAIRIFTKTGMKIA
jgi:hypothetical protein